MGWVAPGAGTACCLRARARMRDELRGRLERILMPLLELRNVSKSYTSGARKTEVLRDINLEIEQGELVAILGFSGSGKTTLINLIAGLDTPDEGFSLVSELFTLSYYKCAFSSSKFSSSLDDYGNF